MAIKVTTDDFGPLWLPKSVVHDDSEVWRLNQEGKLVVASWFADKVIDDHKRRIAHGRA